MLTMLEQWRQQRLGKEVIQMMASVASQATHTDPSRMPSTKRECNLTINDGTMVSYSKIFVGSPGVDDFGQSRIFLNSGLFQGEGLEFNIKADSRIVYKGGELRINKSALTEADMQDLINIGKIDVSVDYEITTIGDYTVLRDDDDY